MTTNVRSQMLIRTYMCVNGLKYPYLFTYSSIDNTFLIYNNYMNTGHRGAGVMQSIFDWSRVTDENNAKEVAGTASGRDTIRHNCGPRQRSSKAIPTF